ncbi:uncharacterized protein LOC127728813 [Mytilus californianus]|uniref:uncharacterized protein LOC127728813 n=1 Tax=Mytilus californianus TaxID=6549 RepID=UPI00224775BF|nr:uncharacterized protein LOC127728813 [Mytilus californianus]
MFFKFLLHFSFGLYVCNATTLKRCNCKNKFVDVADENIPINMCLEKIVVQVDVQLIDVMWADTRRSTEEYVKYTVDVKRILKGENLLTGIDQTNIYALRDFIECGPRMLSRSFSYIVSVNVIKEKMHIDMCSIMVPADFVSNVQLGVMEGRFPCPDIDK